ncbi:hypothetical protein JTB14_016959 [Gonioctena quinquepunctata]|nr:hypothetical protein JTB14_016959 [Gonioctena quinquepunctata]
MASNNYLANVPKLQGRENYEEWSFAMENFLVLEGLSKCIDGTETENELVAKAKAKVVLSLNPSLYVHVKEATTAKEVWDTLKDLYENKGFTRKISLLRNLISLRLENCSSMAEYVNQVIETSQKLSRAGLKFDTSLVGSLLLAGLPDRFAPMVMTLEHSGIGITTDTIKSKLLDMQLDGGTNSTGGAFAIKVGNQKYKCQNNRNKNDSRNKNKDDIICYRCKQPGHFMSKCPQFNQNKGTDKQTKGAFNVVFLNTNFNNNDWYLDSGASVHLTCRQDWLLNQREPIVKDIMIANNSKITVKSSGEVDILTKVGKENFEIEIQNAQYVPELATNLLSISTSRDVHIIEKERNADSVHFFVEENTEGNDPNNYQEVYSNEDSSSESPLEQSSGELVFSEEELSDETYVPEDEESLVVPENVGRSQRERKTKIFEDFVTYFTPVKQANYEENPVSVGDPNSVAEALAGPNRNKWISAMTDEMKSFSENRAWDLVDLPEGPALGVRHVQTVFMLLLLAIGIGMRVHLSVAIVAMTDKKTSSNRDIPTYNWDNKSLILSSFYWGYVVLQVFAAELGRKYGPKRFLLGGMFVNATAMTLVPVMADNLGSYGVMGCRVVMGLAQGCFYCSVQNILTKWIPEVEKTRMSTLALSGASFGTIFTMPIVGYVSSSSLGWPFAFYLYGGLGYVWVCLYFIFGASTPRDHRSITEDEKKYIESNKDTEGSKFDTPWKSILTSVPVWAALCTQIGSVWGYTTLLAEMPIYMNKIIGFDIKSNGLLSATPYLTNFFLGYVFAYISDYFLNHDIISTTWCRKIACTIATFLPATALLVLSFLPQDTSTLSVFMLIIAVGMQSAITSGYMVNHIDLSPNFAGIIMALCNSSSNFVSIFGPVLVQFVVKDETDKSQWRIVFIVASLMYVVPNIFYLLFASGKVQPWDSSNAEELKAQQEKARERSKKMSVISIMST